MKTKIFILLAVLAVCFSAQANAQTQSWKVDRLVIYDAIFGTKSDTARNGLVTTGELTVSENAASLWIGFCTTPAAGSICNEDVTWFMFGRPITKANDYSVTFNDGSIYEIHSIFPKLVISSESNGVVIVFTLTPR